MLNDNIVRLTGDFFLVSLFYFFGKSLYEAACSMRDEIVVQCRCLCLLILGWIEKSSPALVFS